MPTSKLLLRLQSIVADKRLRWAHNPQLWVELFVTANLAILAADIYIAHSVNQFQKAAEYIPLYFSIGAPVILAVILALRWIGKFEAPWRDVGYMVGWLSVLIGLGGVLYHLESRFFLDRTLKSLTYAAPFAAPLAYTGLGFLLLMNRMVGARTRGVGSLGNLPGAGGILWKLRPVVDRPCVKWLLRKDRVDSCHLIGTCHRLPDCSSRAYRDAAIYGFVPDRNVDAGICRRAGFLVSRSVQSC